METTFDFNGMQIHLVHTEQETYVDYLKNGLKVKLEVLSASNNKKAKEISVQVVKTFHDSGNNLITSSRQDYLVNNPQEYSFFYNMDTVEDEGLGFTEYMHALNGATYREEDLTERFFNMDGTLKTY